MKNVENMKYGRENLVGYAMSGLKNTLVN